MKTVIESVIGITIYHRIEHESWQVSDTGGEFDDKEHDELLEAETDAEDREFYYLRLARYVTDQVIRPIIIRK
jgi:hypothetical protein